MAQSAYDFSLFEKYDYGTAAPELVPDYQPNEPIPFPSVEEKKAKKTKKNSYAVINVNNETNTSLFRSLLVIAVTVIVSGLAIYAIHLNSALDEKAKEIIAVEEEIDIAKNVQIKLNSDLSGLVSLDKLKDYAENTLGMVKLESYKITYFESENDNEVVVSGGKSYDLVAVG